MSVQWKILHTDSVEGLQLYEFPKELRTINRIVIGTRSLNFGTSIIDGKKFIVLLEPVEVSGIKMEIIGR